RRGPLVEDGSAPFERHRSGCLQHVGQRFRRLKKMEEDVYGVHTFFVEELEKPDRTAASSVVVPAAGEGDGIDAVGVGFFGEVEERVPPGAGEDGRVEEREPAGGEDRHRREAAGEGLAGPEQAEAMTRYRLDPPRPGDVGVSGRGRLVLLS